MAQIQRRKRVVGHHAGCAATTRQHEQDRTYQGSISVSYTHLTLPTIYSV